MPRDLKTQNIPVRTAVGREIRRNFNESINSTIYVSADYSSIELQIMRELDLTLDDFKTKV